MKPDFVRETVSDFLDSWIFEGRKNKKFAGNQNKKPMSNKDTYFDIVEKFGIFGLVDYSRQV